MPITRPFLALPQPETPAEPAPNPLPPAGHILLIPLDAICTTKLQRDRACHLDPQIEDLKASILATGLSNPIRVDLSRPGKVELVQGWRRLAAYRALLAETERDCFAEIPAIPVADFTPVDTLYRRMVDENMVRKDLSWAEMGKIAQVYADDRAINCDDIDMAIDQLFASASPQKRSYIRHFAELVRRLEKVLAFPQAIPRALGIALNQALKTDPARIGPLCRALRDQPLRDAATELDILRAFAGEPDSRADGFPVHPGPAKPARGRPAKRPGTLLRLDLMGGAVQCTLAPGKVELRLDRDFTLLPRGQLETAVAAFCAALG